MVIALTALLSFHAAADRSAADHNWNDAAVSWRSYESGLAEAKKTGRPVCLIFYTNWCPHCGNYAKVFHDSKVVEMSKRFVMIRLNKDSNRELSARHNVDGQYIPRTYFMSSAGVIATDIHAPRDTYKHFFNENDPRGVLGGMKKALAKLESARAR